MAATSREISSVMISAANNYARNILLLSILNKDIAMYFCMHKCKKLKSYQHTYRGNTIYS